MIRLLLPALALILLLPAASAQNAASALSGSIREVTLYRGTALVTREITLPAGPAGPMEIVVSPLPTATDPASVYADAARGVEVRSVSCRTRPPDDAAEMKSEVALLEQKILGVEQKISNARNEIALRRIRQEYLRNLGNFTAPAARQEMTHGVLQAEELRKVTQMHFTEYETASQEIMKLDFEIDADQKQLAQLRRERDKLAAGPPRTFDTVIYLERLKAGPASFDLNYLVGDCGWSPVYNARGDSAKGEVQLEFNALIHQVSGEDWDDASLQLSTASPTVSAYNPRLTPLNVRISPELAQANQSDSPNPYEASQNAMRYNQALDKKMAAVKGQFRGKNIDEMANRNFDANVNAASVQLIELSERMSELRVLSEDAVQDLSITYELDRPVSLVSRREGQIIPVMQHKVAADYYHVTVPILTAAVFREARITNTTSHDLLGGQVNAYLNGEFTGRTDIQTIARGRQLTLGFGVDGQLRARRSLVDRTETVQGGNQKVEIEVEVVVDNYKDEPVRLHLRERTPYMEDDASLRVSLGETSHPLSTDADYKRFEKPKGILLWQLDVAAGTGDKATSLSYSYALEFDKNMTLQDISNEQQDRMRDEFLKARKQGR